MQYSHYFVDSTLQQFLISLLKNQEKNEYSSINNFKCINDINKIWTLLHSLSPFLRIQQKFSSSTMNIVPKKLIRAEQVSRPN